MHEDRAVAPTITREALSPEFNMSLRTLKYTCLICSAVARGFGRPPPPLPLHLATCMPLQSNSKFILPWLLLVSYVVSERWLTFNHAQFGPIWQPHKSYTQYLTEMCNEAKVRLDDDCWFKIHLINVSNFKLVNKQIIICFFRTRQHTGLFAKNTIIIHITFENKYLFFFDSVLNSQLADSRCVYKTPQFFM